MNPDDLRLFLSSLANHPGPPYATLFGAMTAWAGWTTPGVPPLVWAPLSLVWRVPVIWTAWTDREIHGGDRDG